MVANIRSGSSPGGALYYNKEKVDKGEAEVLFRQKMLEPFDRYGRLDIDACMESFRPYLEANRRTINTVFHTSLNPSPVDELTDEQLRDITREYMERMGYGQQPYIVFKHKDISREHLHIVSLRVDENGRKISDSHEYDRSMSVLRELERKYGLHLAPGKDSVQRERLREPDKTKYEIYDAIKGCLPKCKSWNDLEGRLKEQGIDVRYKYCGNTDRKQGVLFSKNDFEFSESKIDRQFSFSKLNRHFAYAQQQTLHRSAIVKDFHAAAGTYRSERVAERPTRIGRRSISAVISANFRCRRIIRRSNCPSLNCNANPARVPKSTSPASRVCSIPSSKRWRLPQWSGNVVCENA